MVKRETSDAKIQWHQVIEMIPFRQRSIQKHFHQKQLEQFQSPIFPTFFFS